jgi:hypothetical protein
MFIIIVIYYKLLNTLIDFINSPDLVFQILIDLSYEQLTNVYPSGENTTDITYLVCPYKNHL